MNILQFICPTGLYGAERWVLALVKHLPPTIRCDLAITIEPGTQDHALEDLFGELGGTCHRIQMSSRFDIRVLSRLKSIIRDNDIDIIHTHGYKSDIIGVMASRLAGVPCISTPHGFENASDIKLQAYIWAGCRALRHANMVVPLSSQLERECMDHGIPRDRIKCIQNGVDITEIEARIQQRETDPESDKIIGYIGQLITRKNIRDLLDVFDSIHKRHRNTRLILIGDGDQRRELEAYAGKLESRENIEFLGYRRDRLELLGTFDAFVMTSTLEGIPRCLMEAAASCVPIAAYDIPGVDQIVQHGRTGLLAPLGDRNTLQEHCETLLFDREKAEHLAKSAKALVEEKFSAERMALEYASLYADIHGSHRPGNT